MKCPNCGNENFVKNGHSKYQRWKCKICNKTYDENSLKGYPGTKTPFEFIAFVLYKWEQWNNQYTFCKFVNLLLKMTNEKEVSKGAIYSWKEKYKDDYKKVPEEEAYKWFFVHQIRILDKTFNSKISKNRNWKGRSRNSKKELSKERPPLIVYKDFLKWLNKLCGKEICLTMARHHPEFFKEMEENYIMKNSAKISMIQRNYELTKATIEREKELCV